MKAHLTFKQADPWSGYTLWDGCSQDVGPYLMRSGRVYSAGLEHEEVLREELEKALGLDLSPSSSFWETFRIPVTDKGVFLDTDIPDDKLKYYYCKNHKRVAFGLKDNKPSTDYVLLQAEEEAKEANVKSKLKRKAILEFDKLSPDEMRRALRVMGYNSTKTSNEVAENTLYKLVEENPEKFLDSWVKNEDKDTVFLIEEAVSKNILRKNKTIYKYGSDVVGRTLEDAVDYLNDPANSDIRITIMSLLEGKEVTFGTKKPNLNEGQSQFSKIMKEIEAEEIVEEPKEEVKKTKKTK